MHRDEGSGGERSALRIAVSIGFKEWALVCEALNRGDQSVIVRKGGIAEGRDGFRFKHQRFFLFPTLFHEQLERTRLPAGTALPAFPPGLVRIDALAEVEWTRLVTDRSRAQALEPFHILTRAVVDERFDYDEPKGVNVAFVRVYRLGEPWEFPMRPAYGGCRSWVDLPEPWPATELTAAITDEDHAARGAALADLAGGE
jgi:hypothetical protein